MTENTPITEGKSQIELLWERICEKLSKSMNPFSYETTIRGVRPAKVVNRLLILEATTDMAASTLKKSSYELIRDTVVSCGAGFGLVGFDVYVEGSDLFSLSEIEESSPYPVAPINKNFTFDSFVVGAENKLVYEAAKTVAENPGAIFNPLFIYGESGLGKTHLMHAIANLIAERAPEKKVLYTTCENFLNEFIDSLSQKNGAGFRNHYRSVDVLMIDDIQFLKDRKGTQEEFFHTFNELTSQNKQIVLTSDRHPKELATLEERLRTRFAGGMIADIQPPLPETKIAILQRKALDKKYIITNDVLEFLAQDSGHDVRTLEGRLTKVIFASKLHEEPITLRLAQRALNEAVSETQEEEEITPETIINAACAYFKQKREDVVGKSRNADFVKARQICAYLIYEQLSVPLDTIGQILGGRDHTTIMHARDKIAKLITLNNRIAKEVDDIKNIVLKK
ncbi:MAG: chromosomal replication initiator protein DnaA [Clostridia bacterium]|nr:chromosomal replication initiator protein DnaA [Clostridia bacterium]